ncbi:class IIb bacteriocin, lactobin A/cerein 7B family [Hymenobacter metallicola]|uniref:Class IIb bacteriocin, lactobin A/cerein 7B family n=2 Tax=Hymenobacter metallicola TaxID=2563114 RepID=A0A4Z0QGF2_9BACT|nr:class IIb bacteriocin, lactobin A/cerein 7B family [Hymenobacter metallicola]
MNNLSQVHFGGQTALFEKRAIVELSLDEMMQIDGGTTPACVAVGATAAIFWTGVQIGRAIYDATHAD